MMKEVDKKNTFDSGLGMPADRMVEALPIAAFLCEQNGIIVSCSEEVLPFFGLNDNAKIIGSRLPSFFAFDAVEEAYLLLSMAFRTNGRHSKKLLVKKNVNGTRSADVSFSSFENDDSSRKFALVVFRELSGAETDIDEINKKGARVSRICDILIDNRKQVIEKTQKLVSQVGETFGALTCAYFLVENGKLNLLSAWESPFNPGISAQLFSEQIFDYISDRKEDYALIRKPILSTFIEPEKLNATESGVKTLLGIPLGFNRTEGILTAIFSFNFSLTKDDEQFIRTISTLMSDQFTIENQPPISKEYSTRELIDCFADPVYIVSAEGKILEVNKSTISHFGYDREELIGKSSMVLTAEDLDQIAAVYRNALRTEPQKFEWWGKRKNGDMFPLEITCSKSRYNEQEVILVVARDMNETKKNENELTKINQELEESNNSKDKFLSILAHDLKDPFQGLLGFIDLLYDDLDELSIAQVKEYLVNVKNASYHTYTLLENLLDWSRIQNGKMPFNPLFFNIKDEINSVISLLSNNARTKNIKLINEVDEDVKVEADRNMIHSVIQNLVTNSIKFTNNRGRVVIRGREMQTELNDQIIPGEKGQKWFQISIADDGIGIPEEILPKLFKLNGQYSQSGTAKEPGTGLGLALCHEMVEKNGGRIWAESIAGQGTTFIFTIPMYHEFPENI